MTTAEFATRLAIFSAVKRVQLFTICIVSIRRWIPFRPRTGNALFVRPSSVEVWRTVSAMLNDLVSSVDR